MQWLRETLTDEKGIYDVAYVSLFCVMGGVFSAILTMTIMSIVAFLLCEEVMAPDHMIRVCTYEAQSLGIAIGAACGGFATALAALAGYMAATRRPRKE